MAKYSTDKFNYHKPSNTFYAEASTLTVMNSEQMLEGFLGRNFRLVSAKTGNVLVAQLLETKKDFLENEILSWEYELCSDEGYTGIKVTVFND